MPEPITYIVEIDLPDADRAQNFAAFVAWYAHVHAPHLYEAGFTTCTSYRAVAGEMQIVDIYQADGWSVFESERFGRYRRIAAADPHLPAFMLNIPNQRTPYLDHPFASSADGPSAPIACDWLTIWRFGADDALFDLAAGWLGAGGEAELIACGARAVSLLRRTREAPTGTTNRPQGAVLLQWREQPRRDAPLPDGMPQSLREAISARPAFTGYRLYPWPDEPALRDPAHRTG